MEKRRLFAKCWKIARSQLVIAKVAHCAAHLARASTAADSIVHSTLHNRAGCARQASSRSGKRLQGSQPEDGRLHRGIARGAYSSCGQRERTAHLSQRVAHTWQAAEPADAVHWPAGQAVQAELDSDDVVFWGHSCRRYREPEDTVSCCFAHSARTDLSNTALTVHIRAPGALLNVPAGQGGQNP